VPCASNLIVFVALISFLPLCASPVMPSLQSCDSHTLIVQEHDSDIRVDVWESMREGYSSGDGDWYHEHGSGSEEGDAPADVDPTEECGRMPRRGSTAWPKKHANHRLYDTDRDVAYSAVGCLWTPSVEA
jgi:hypothetical protein